MNRNSNKYGKAYAIVGMVMAISFMIFWIGTSAMIGAPFIFPLFGIGMLVMITIQFMGRMNSYKEQENRRKAKEEYYDNVEYTSYTEPKKSLGFCPHCGAKIEHGFKYCPKCGNPL